MGYTHYWYKEKEIPKEIFNKIVEDFKKVLPRLDKLMTLAGGGGEGDPVITEDLIDFNGSINCGHLKNEAISIPWPSNKAGGIAGYTEDVMGGTWYAGAMIDKRCCNGDCSYETFRFTRITDKADRPSDNGKYFDCCKTAFRPYDLAVNIVLIIAKHYLQDKIIVRSDGEEPNWWDGKMICQFDLGYGLEFKLDAD